MKKKKKYEFEMSEEGLNVFRDIVLSLPTEYFTSDWHLVYNPNKHGYSFNEFLRKNQDIGPHIM